MARPETFSPSQVAAMLGVGKDLVLARIRAGQLQASPLARGTKGGVTYRVTRSHLTQFLVANNFPLDRLRRVLNPDGAVLLCGTMPSLQHELSHAFRTRHIDSLFELGRALETVPAWAAVVNLQQTGATLAAEAFRTYFREADRPDLVALVGDDGLPVRCSPIPFDLVLPAAAPPAVLARSIATLRTSG